MPTQIPLVVPRFVSPLKADGTVNALGLVYTYSAGTLTPKTTYTDSTGGTANANPVVLDAAGQAAIWGTGTYKIVVKTAAEVTITTDDNYTSFATSTSGSTFADNAFTVQDNSDVTKQFVVELSGITTGSTVTMTIPDANFTPIGAATTQTLTNKTLDTTTTLGIKDSLFTIKDDSDTTKIAQFQASGITTATTRTFTFPDASGTLALSSTVSAVTYNAQSTTYTLLAGDNSKLVDFTGSSDATWTFTAAATLGSGWFCYIRNNGTANAELTIDGAGAELIDGLANYKMYPGEVRLVQCTGAAFNTFVISGFDTGSRTSTFTFTKPPGYKSFDVWLGAGGGSGGKGVAANAGNGGGGGACHFANILASTVGTTESVTVAAGGVAQGSADTAGNVGGNTTFGSLLTSYGGGGGGQSATNGGGGGGQTSVGVQGDGTANGGGPAGGAGGSAAVGGSSYAGGAGGGDNAAALGYTGGDSYWGGGGGGGASQDATNTNGAGGTSVYGGAGGGAGAEDSAPGAGAGGVSKFGGGGGAGAFDASTATTGTAATNGCGGGGGGGSETGTSGAGGAGSARIIGIV